MKARVRFRQATVPVRDVLEGLELIGPAAIPLVDNLALAPTVHQSESQSRVYAVPLPENRRDFDPRLALRT